MSETGDTALLGAVARGVLALAEVDAAAGFAMPYPEPAQSALDLLTLTLLLRGEEAPRGLPELVGWCGGRPLAEWPLRLPEHLVGADDLLVDARTRLPTGVCAAWAADGGEVRTGPVREHLERTVPPQQHVDCLVFLAGHPVVTDPEITGFARSRAEHRLWRLLKPLYQPVPRASLVRDEVVRCTGCRALVVRLSGGWRCENETCPQAEAAPERLPSTGVVALPGPVRRTVAGVGRVVRVVVTLARERGGTAVAEPEGLRLEWPGGARRWVLVLDHANPALLARELRRSPWLELRPLVVVPALRLVGRPDYREVMARELPDAPRVLSDAELVGLAGGDLAIRSEA